MNGRTFQLPGERKTWLMFGAALMLSAFSAVLAGFYGLAFGMLIPGLFVALPTAWAMVTYPRFGLLILFLTSFLLAFVNRVFNLYALPLGVVYDVMIGLITLGLLLESRNRQTEVISNTRNYFGILLAIWAVLNLLQVVNPVAPSLMGWFMAVKSNLYPIIYFFLFYYVLKDLRDIRLFTSVWIFLMLLAALYGFNQRFIGLAPYESFVYTNELKRSLYITWGQLRVFSFLNDPMSFGITVMYTLVLLFGLLFTRNKPTQKIYYLVAFALGLVVLLLTGTRTAYFLLPVGIVVFGFVTMNRRILLASLGGLVIGAGVVFTSSNPQLHVFKTAFRGSEDASMNVRLKNQQMIRPYIQRKPFGWGLASTGGFGRKYNGGSLIGNFPPDSEYVRIAIENGWLGLGIWLLIQALMFRKAALDYVKIADENQRILFATFLTLFFLIIVAQYPQEALRVPPTGILTGFILAVLAKLPQISRQQPSQNEISADLNL